MPTDSLTSISDGLNSVVEFFKTPWGTAILASAGAFLAGLFSPFLTTSALRKSHRERLDAETQLADRKIDADLNIADQKFKFDVEITNRKFALDARQSDRKKRQDLAEEVLSGFYEVRQIIAAVRSPAAFGNEGANRPRSAEEPEDLRRSRDVYYVPIERLAPHNDLISTLLSRRFRMTAWFGDGVERPFQRISEAVNGVIWAANNLIRHVETQPMPTSWGRWESIIWAGAEEPDATAGAIDAAIAEIEAICRPILAEPPIV